MKSLIGDPNNFAIELRLEISKPAYGGVRLWVNGQFIGDFDEGMDWHYFAQQLKNLLKSTLRVYERDVPIKVSDFCSLRGHMLEILGGCFDRCTTMMFYINECDAIQFLWLPYDDYPSDYCSKYNCVSKVYTSMVDYPLFRSVVDEFFRWLTVNHVTL